MNLALYRALTALAEGLATPWALAARAAGGDRAARFGFGQGRGATWVHAASVGEVNAAAPLVRALGAHRPSEDRLVSAGTTSGLAAWRNELERRPPGGAPVTIEAWPLDFPGATRRAFETRLLAGVLAPLLARVSACAAQSEADAERWARLGMPRDALTVTGNTKYDQLATLPTQRSREAMRLRLGVPENVRLLVWGSARPGEEVAIAEAARALADLAPELEPRFALVAVPRHPGRAAAQRAALERAGARVDDWAPGRAWPAAPQAGAARVVWAPVLGVLRDLYEVAEVAVVGGTFAPYGGHNVAEPAALGVPVAVGPHHANARDVVDALVGRGGGAVAGSGRGVAEAALAWTRDAAALGVARAGARHAVEDLAGATARTLGFLEARGFWG